MSDIKIILKCQKNIIINITALIKDLINESKSLPTRSFTGRRIGPLPPSLSKSRSSRRKRRRLRTPYTVCSAGAA